jgi:uncharacterized membrane protein YbhN (UPF0104 family)
MAPFINKLNKPRSRRIIAVIIIVLTVIAFSYYISKHRSLITELEATPPLLIIAIMILYTAWFGSLAGIMLSSLRICKKKLPVKESFLLNAYSTLVNFFVPGQGGIAVRGVYLKKVRDLKFRNYILTTLIYYGIYAFVSILLLLVDSRPWWQTVLAAIIVGGASLGVIKLYQKNSKTDVAELDLTTGSLAQLLMWTVIQAVVQVTIYGVELHRVNKYIKLTQMVTYTGAANFSLFVSLTPGAIGIRESFLLLSRRLHHITESNIISASVIDRGVFIVFLGILFVITLSFHAKNRSLLQNSSKMEVSSRKADLKPSAK